MHESKVPSQTKYALANFADIRTYVCTKCNEHLLAHYSAHGSLYGRGVWFITRSTLVIFRKVVAPPGIEPGSNV
jgi:hypothetical protein